MQPAHSFEVISDSSINRFCRDYSAEEILKAIITPVIIIHGYNYKSGHWETRSYELYSNCFF
jgi:hypothetical protein